MLKKSRLLKLLLLIAPLSFATASEQPNVLLIAVDDLNNFPTFTGRYPDAQTPNMDRLAEQGTVFTQAYCQFPLCGPSRASIMSGLHPITLGYERHVKDEKVQERAAELGTELLHTYFANRGYKTMAVGKVFHSHVPKGTVDESGGRGGFNSPTGKLGKNWPQKGTSTDWAAVDDELEPKFPDYEAAEWAVERLQQTHDKPFLLMVGFLRPHVAWYAPQKYFDLYDKEKITLPRYEKYDLDDVPQAAKDISILDQMPRTDWAIENNQWRNILHAYLACISFVDAQVGKVLDALEASPHADNTIVVLYSDHGYHIGEKNTFQKQSLWERSTKVPMIIAGPGTQANMRSDRVVSLIDIYPTILEMAGLPANPKNEGRSLVPLLKDPALNWPYPAFTGWKQDSFSIQTERYHYIRYKDGSEELYDHSKDLDEITNLATNPEYASVKAQLLENLNAFTQARQ